jgi:toxin ParE1/3/4
MHTPYLAPGAQRDVIGILAWSEERFGASARARYEQLIETAIRDVAIDPERPGSRARPELGPGIGAYHLSFSRQRARGPGGIIRTPRHLLIYRLLSDTELEIVRVLHDAMELGQHLPDEQQHPDEEE